MKYVFSRTLLFLLSVFVASSGQDKFHLELVQVLMRHGARTPSLEEIQMYPNNRYNVSAFEPYGLGQLTNQGKYLQYQLGQMLRQRYDKFLGQIYYPEDIYAYSTDIDRTKVSLQLTLAGLCPPSTPQIWNPNLLWFPIPIHSAPSNIDILLKYFFCPIYNAAVRNVSDLQEIRDKIVVYRDFFNFLSKKLGTSITKPLDVSKLYQLVTALKAMNLTIPDWCTDEVYKQMQDVTALMYDIHSYTTELKQLNAGMIIKMFIDNWNDIDNREPPRKMYIYCGHDINIAFFIRAHNISEPKLPNYGTTIIFEKLRDKSGRLYVRILLLNDPKEMNMITLKLANCDEICPLESYLELIRNVIPSEAESSKC